MSPYLNRELSPNDREALEGHLMACPSCGDEFEILRMMVAGLRALPPVRPPREFASRVMARWSSECDSAELAERAEAATRIPEEAPVAESRPLAMVGSGPPPAQPPSWLPPQRRNDFKSFYAMAATFVVAFVAALLFRGTPNMDPVALKQSVFDSMLPINLNLGGQRQGPAGRWNTASLQMVPNTTAARPTQPAQVQVQIPRDVQLEIPHRDQHLLFPLEEDEQSSSEVVLIPCSMPAQGSWEQQLRWRAQREGHFRSWVEVRCDGLYRRQEVEFVATP